MANVMGVIDSVSKVVNKASGCLVDDENDEGCTMDNTPVAKKGNEQKDGREEYVANGCHCGKYFSNDRARVSFRPLRRLESFLDLIIRR